MKAVKEAHLKGKMMKESKFECGEIYLTTGANSLIAENAINIIMLLSRHGSGDWGDLCDEDKKANDSAISYGQRLLSSYDTVAGKLWIITESGRHATTVLLPSEY
tara:strand:- start:1109 stop:1423 length:315 start_codon:yes stop_codon:yes gene_type:complete